MRRLIPSSFIVVLASSLLGGCADGGAIKTSLAHAGAPSRDAAAGGALSRHRRFAFPSGSGVVFQTDFYLYVPVTDAVWRLEFELPFSYDIDTGVLTGRRRRRGLRTYEDSRHAALRQLERYAVAALPKGTDAHACALRALCEVAQTPLHADGLLGHLANSLLMPAHLLETHLAQQDDRRPASDYLAAQARGQLQGDCTPYKEDCDITIFKVEDNSVLNLEDIDDDDVCASNSTTEVQWL